MDTIGRVYMITCTRVMLIAARLIRCVTPERGHG